MVLASLAWPVAQTLTQTIAFSRPSTRELASTYIQEVAPWGATFVQESYTPHLHFKKYPTRKSRFAARLPMEQIRDPRRDYLLLSQNAYGRFLEPANWAKPHHEIYFQRYQEMLEFELVRDFAPDRFTQGPYVRLFKIDPENVVYHRSYRFDFEAEPYFFPKDGGFLLLKEYFEPGRYEIRVQTEPVGSEGRVRVVSRTNQQAGEVSVGLEPASVEMKGQAKYFFYVYFPKDTLLRSLEIARLDPDA